MTEAASLEAIEKYILSLSPDAQAAFLLQFDREYDQSQEDLWERCRTDLWFWMRNYCRAINLHVEAKVDEGDDPPDASIDLFPDYPHIHIVAKQLRVPKNVIIEKSRDMMATWSVCAVFLHDLMFVEGAPLMMASKTFNDVDDGGPESTPDSLLGRVRFLHQNLPEWMRARAPLRIKTGLMRNELTKAFIVGLKAVRSTGRSGKYRRALADEFGFWDYGESNLAAMKYACQTGLVLLSTPPPTGRHHSFGRLATSTTDIGFHKVTLHWSMHPLRDVDWYMGAKAGMDPEDVARELDISYSGAVSSRVYPMFDESVHRIEGLAYDPNLPLYTAHDFGVNEETCLFIQVDAKTNTWFIIDEYQGGKAGEHTGQAGHEKNLTPWDNAAAIRRILLEPPYNLVIGPNGQIVGLAGSYGDPSGKVENLINKAAKRDDDKLTSYHAVYGQHGLVIRSEFTKQRDGIAIIRDQLKVDEHGKTKLYVASHCTMTWDAFIHHQRKRDVNTKEYLSSVVEDWTKHPMDAARYFAIGKEHSLAAHGKPAGPVYRQVWKSSPTGSRYPTLERVA